MLCLRVLKQFSQKSKSSQLLHLNLAPLMGNIWHPSHLKIKDKQLHYMSNILRYRPVLTITFHFVSTVATVHKAVIVSLMCDLTNMASVNSLIAVLNLLMAVLPGYFCTGCKECHTTSKASLIYGEKLIHPCFSLFNKIQRSPVLKHVYYTQNISIWLKPKLVLRQNSNCIIL